MTRLLRDVSLGALILVLATAVASAQLSTAELSGRVTDPSGAVLPGVTVTMTQTATRATRTAVTNADGAYVLSNLPTGPYQLEVSLQGFHRAAGGRHADDQRRSGARRRCRDHHC
jgi:carboxypeptidase family protein